MKIVQFKNGKYAIRKLSIFGYKFLAQNGYWLSLESFKKLNMSLGDSSLYKVETVYDELNDVGVIVK